MAKKELHNRVIALRKEGKSYSQIKAIVPVAKSTLSVWLEHMPLSKEQMVLLRDKNPVRIEKYRRTCALRREKVLECAYGLASKQIGKITKRELYVSGFFLYWGEGTKRYDTTTTFTNTDPHMIRIFVKWIGMLGVPKRALRVKLHIYSDMDESRTIDYWCKEVGFNRSQFKKTYVKESALSGITYTKGVYGHGTCNVIYSNRQLNDFVLQGIQYIRDTYAPIA